MLWRSHIRILYILFLFFRFFACEWTYSKADNDTPVDLVYYFFLSFFWEKKSKNIYKNLVKPWNQNCTIKFTLQMNEDLYKNSLHGYIYTNTDITLMLEIMLFLPLSMTNISYNFLVKLYISAWSCAWWLFNGTAKLMLSPILLNNNNINNSPQELLERTHVQASLSKTPLQWDTDVYGVCVWMFGICVKCKTTFVYRVVMVSLL